MAMKSRWTLMMLNHPWPNDTHWYRANLATATVLPVLAVEARDFAGGFPIGGAFFQIGAFIARDFSLGNTKLGFQLPVFPMQIEKNKSTSGNLGFAIESIE